MIWASSIILKIRAVFIHTDDDGNGLFHYAVRGGKIPLLKKLVDRGIPYTLRNRKEGNALLAATQGVDKFDNPLAVFTYLEDLGLDPASSDTEGTNPLHAVARKTKDISLLDYFMEKGVAVDQENKEGITPFMNAAAYNELPITRHLSSRVTDIDKKDKKGRTALALAVARNSPEVVAHLLEKGADVTLKDNKGNTLAYYLMDAFRPEQPEGFERKMELLMNKGLDITAMQANGNTLLHLAAQNNDLPLMKKLESFDFNMDKKNNDGNTALHLAAMSTPDGAMLKYLHGRGADKNLKTEFGESVYDLISENERLQSRITTLDYLK